MKNKIIKYAVSALVILSVLLAMVVPVSADELITLPLQNNFTGGYYKMAVNYNSRQFNTYLYLTNEKTFTIPLNELPIGINITVIPMFIDNELNMYLADGRDVYNGADIFLCISNKSYGAYFTSIDSASMSISSTNSTTVQTVGTEFSVCRTNINGSVNTYSHSITKLYDIQKNVYVDYNSVSNITNYGYGYTYLSSEFNTDTITYDSLSIRKTVNIVDSLNNAHTIYGDDDYFHEPDIYDIDISMENTSKFLDYPNTADVPTLWDRVYTENGLPILRYSINDYNKYDTYTLRLYCCDKYSEILENVNKKYEQEVADRKENGEIWAFFRKNLSYWKELPASAHLLAVLKNPDIVQYDLKKTFTGNDMTFSSTDKPYNPIRLMSIRLDEYINVRKYQLYKFTITNSQNIVIASCYMTPNDDYNFGDYGYGTKRYEYSDDETLNNDIATGNFENYNRYNENEKLDVDNDNLINVGVNDYTGGIPDINSIVGILNTTITSMGNFMQSIYSMLPMQFMAVIVLGIALIVILRILGR